MPRLSRTNGWNLSDEPADVYDATGQFTDPPQTPETRQDTVARTWAWRQVVTPAAIGLVAAVVTCILAIGRLEKAPRTAAPTKTIPAAAPAPAATISPTTGRPPVRPAPKSVERKPKRRPPVTRAQPQPVIRTSQPAAPARPRVAPGPVAPSAPTAAAPPAVRPPDMEFVLGAR